MQTEYQSPVTGAEIFFDYIGQLYADSISPTLSLPERQDLTNRIKSLSDNQRKQIHAAIGLQELLSDVAGDYRQSDYWSNLAAYFRRSFTWREFRVVNGRKN